MSQTATSNIAMALAGKTASVDIPKPRTGYAPTSARRSGASRPGQSGMLPTPPNSISPNLRPQTFKDHTASVDSDIDLKDVVESTNRRDQLQPASRGSDNVGEITSAMLARYYLPEILLLQGPLAIRNIMAYLTTSVPGFSRIPPNKSRRLVVAALEGRGNGEGSGHKGDVIFEKVGWGRWDARRHDEPSRTQQAANTTPPSSVPKSFQPQGLQIPGNSSPWSKRDSVSTHGTSATGTSAVFSHMEMDDSKGEDISMLEHEADKMSLDGDECDYCSSEAPDDIQDEDWDEGDITDEEDWAQIGAAGLRAQSLNGGGGYMHAMRQPPLPGGGPASSSLAKSAPHNVHFQPREPTLPEGIVQNAEERTAAEALLRLGSI